MSNFLDRPIIMARDLAERATARQIVLDVLTEVGKRPLHERNEAADSLLHQRLLKEMCDYKDRLNNAAGLLLLEAKAALWDPLESTCRHASLSIL